MTAEEEAVRDALAAMLDAMPADLRAECEAEIAAGIHPPGIHLAHRTGRRFEAVWGGRHLGTLLWPEVGS